MFIANRGGSAIVHHGQVPAVESAFDKQLKTEMTSIKEMGKPFIDENADLHALYTPRRFSKIQW